MRGAEDLRHLAAAMAHEVRNPLNSMAIHVELMEGRLKKGAQEIDADALLKSIAVLQGEIVRIDGILEEYLEHAGPIEAARRPVQVSAFLGAALDRARAEADLRRITFQLEVPKTLGPWTLDADAFGYAIDALFANAAQASAPGGKVEVRAGADGDHAEVIVTDRGEGIARSELPKIFRIGFTTRQRAGLGLTVAKQIVKGHGGSITVTSEGIGQGTTVRVRLPLE